MSIDPSLVRDSLWAFSMQALQYSILLLDEAAVIVWASPGAETILDGSDLVGRPVAFCFPPDDVEAGVPEFEIEVARSRGWVEDDRWMRRADGSLFWAEGMTIRLRDEDGGPKGFLKLFRNRTQQKMAHDTLRNQAAAAKSQLDCQHTAIATVAHELRTPLASIQNCVHVLQDAATGDPRAGQALDILKRSAANAVRLVNDIVDVERGALGKLALQFATVSVEEVLRSALHAAKSNASMAQRQIDLIVPAEDVQVEADAMRLQQVLVNLIGNAIRYTPGTGRIWVTAVTQGDAVLIKVEDDGYGIEPGDLQQIFELFSQAAVARGRGGLGIGLALVKQIVELHHGTVQAQSNGAGKGSEFSVRIPLRQQGGTAAESRDAR